MLTVNHLFVNFGKHKVIKDVSFEVKPGTIVGLIGPNGAGKTTIMETILGLIKFKGNVEINGSPISDSNHQALTNVGALIEHPAIYPYMSGRENLKLYAHSQENLKKVVSLLQMDEYIDRKSKDYSLGMKQKLGIAIALLNDPKMVILDEPMNGLDIEATILIRKIIKLYAEQGTSFLISSHVLGELEKIITDVLLLDRGKLLLNKPIANFQLIDYSTYLLQTDKMKHTETILKENQLKYGVHNNYFNILGKDINLIQVCLYKNNIKLIELMPRHYSLEQKIVELLESEGELDNE